MYYLFTFLRFQRKCRFDKSLYLCIGFIRSMKIVFAGLQLFALMEIVSCITSKRRLCVDYEIPSYRANWPQALGEARSRIECISSCVRHTYCMAVNYNPSCGVCELLPEAEICMPVNSSHEFSYIHLTTCGGHSPWRTEGANSDYWQWIPSNNPASINDSLVPMVSDFTRFVARVLHNGAYIPGWWKDDGGMTRATLPTEAVQGCPTSKTTFLSFAPTRSYSWVPFTAGDPVPEGAVVGGTLPHSIPLYVMKVTAHGFTISGYYRADMKKNFVTGMDFISTTTMDLLVLNWDNASRGVLLDVREVRLI